MKSFVSYPADSDFPVENLPYGIFSTRDNPRPRVGVAIGAQILDLSLVAARGLFGDPRFDGSDLFGRDGLNEFMALGRPAWGAARAALQRLLAPGSPIDGDASLFVPQAGTTMHVPARIGDYTDFYSSRQHAVNVGSLFRDPENALHPNWLHLPVGYHGRASSIVVSGQGIVRPTGQTRPGEDGRPGFGPSRMLDFELELGVFVGRGNPLGEAIPIGLAAEHLFGCVLVNDWSARDIQAWEYVPLGPFLSKNFATSISPWVVTLDALEPFRVPGPEQQPPPLPYLQHRAPWNLDLQLEVALQSRGMAAPVTIVRGNARELYWSMAQQLAHHTVAGCNLRPGDLLASGTISGDEPASLGSLLELTRRGERSLALPDGERRAFLEDYDTVVMRAYAQGDGYRIGFGEVRGTILPTPAGSERPEEGDQ